MNEDISNIPTKNRKVRLNKKNKFRKYIIKIPMIAVGYPIKQPIHNWNLPILNV